MSRGKEFGGLETAEKKDPQSDKDAKLSVYWWKTCFNEES